MAARANVMTIEELEERVRRLECKVAELRGELVQPFCSVEETFGNSAHELRYRRV